MTMLRGILLFVILATISACSENLAGNRPYILATGTTGGTYYPVGVALATITKAQLYESDGISLSAISSAGSMENIKLMSDNQAQFALLQGVFAAWARDGTGPYRNPQPWLRTITTTWNNAEHFALLTELVHDGTIMDLDRLDGQRFVMGARNSGAASTGDHILTSLGIDYRNKFTLAWMGFGATANAIQDGTIVGMNTPGGMPLAGMTQAFATMGNDLTLLEFTDEQLARINSSYPLWIRWVIPADTYPNQSKAVNSIAHPNVLVVRADVPEDAVYKITKSIFENLPALHEIHGATRELTLENATRSLGAPLHPGAARYYRERGLEITPDLLAP